MRHPRRLLTIGFVVLTTCCARSAYPGDLPAPTPSQDTPVVTAADLTTEAKEAFLLTARIGDRRGAGQGVTNSTRATLSDGTLTHDAQIQSVDISQTAFNAGRASEVNFKDTYRYNIAGYRLARLLGLENVPVSVERRIDGKMAAVTWWIDDVAMTEKERVKKKTAGPNPARTAEQLQVMRVFDELIQNKDRNQGNIVWTSDWSMWLIDHTRAFRLGKDLLHPRELRRCDRALLARLRELTPQSLETAMDDALTAGERDAVIARRDRIVQHFDELIKANGEAAVLFELQNVTRDGTR